jgi:hypothetical protein
MTDDGPLASWPPQPPEALDDTRAEPRLDVVPPATTWVSHAGSTGLAVCPYCHTVWQLEPIFPEPVKLMICWRCAEQRAGLRPQLPAVSKPPQIAREGRAVRLKVIVAYGALLVIGLSLGFAAVQAWFGGASLRSLRATGLVSVTPAVENANARTPANAAPAAQLPEPEPASAVTELDEPVAAGRPGPAARIEEARPASPARLPAPSAGGRAAAKDIPRPTPPAQAPSEMVCTRGRAALGLCILDTSEERHSP